MSAFGPCIELRRWQSMDPLRLLGYFRHFAIAGFPRILRTRHLPLIRSRMMFCPRQEVNRFGFTFRLQGQGLMSTAIPTCTAGSERSTAKNNQYSWGIEVLRRTYSKIKFGLACRGRVWLDRWWDVRTSSKKPAWRDEVAVENQIFRRGARDRSDTRFK